MWGQQEEEKKKPDAGPDLTPGEEDIGYALPIKIRFRAGNRDAFAYMYEVLAEKPMAELHRLIIRSMSEYNPSDQTIDAETTFIIVPKLFDTIDIVRSILKEIRQEDAPTTTAETAQAAPAGS